jgi:uncharacterized cupredoxin-like copper-binding protein
MTTRIGDHNRARPGSRRWAVASLAAVGLLGLVAALLSFAVAPASGQARARAAAGATVINVTLGKPSELRMKLSSGSVPIGKVTFKVTNRGKKSHAFKVCSGTTLSTVANTCLGTATKLIKPGGSASLTVTLTLGIHEYLSSVVSEAKAGMKGGLDVVEAVAPEPVDTTPDTTCARPTTTNVTVDIVEYTFTVTPSSAPCGTIVFAITNSGTLEHDFNIVRYGSLRLQSEYVQPGDATTFTAVLNPGNHNYICDVFGHAMLGLTGNFRVTG